MGYVKLRFSPHSRFSGLFTADQLWGQMVWALSDLKGEDEANAFVEAFKSTPPFLISAMFPDGYLPVPFLPYAGESTEEEWEIENHNKKCRWLLWGDFSRVQQKTGSFFSQKFPVNDLLHLVTEIHVSINRGSLTAMDGGLYNQQFVSCENPLCVYIRFLDEDTKWPELIDLIISYWEKVGLGGDKNVGKGQFAIGEVPLTKEEDDIFSFPDGNCFMTLSKTFGHDLVPLFYQMEAYEGVVGKGFPNGASYYRKKPIIQFLPGSLFKEGTGSLATEMSIEPRVCTYGYAMPVSINFEDKK